MHRCRALFQKAKLTLDELGEKMGYSGKTTRASAWQFLHKSNDPRVSMLRKFAQAVGVKVADLFRE
jgi:transcriptional regulator with XRE-family HTH domain